MDKKLIQSITKLSLGVICLMLFFQINTYAQSGNIVKGKVTDSKTNEAIPGANVIIKGTTTGEMTNENGEYSIKVQQGAVLEFSMVGMTTKEVTVGTQTVINVALDESVTSLTAAVVVGYGSVQKRDLTTAVSNVTSADFLPTAITNPAQLIQGRAAGVSVSSTAPTDPNAGVDLQVRGAASISAGNGPLIVIDNVPGGNLMSINQSDIESITVLKDASSAAIYGTRGANGVILVTTKKGRKGSSTSIDFDTFLSTMTVANRPKVLTAEEFLAHNRGVDLGARVDWYDELVRNFPFEQNWNLALAGGGENSAYRISLNYRDADGLDIATTRKEYAYMANFSHKAFDGLIEFFGNVNQRFAKMTYSNYDAFNQAIQLNPTMPIMDPNNPARYNLPKGYDTWNPIADLNLLQRPAQRKYLNGDLTLKVNILKNLSSQVMVAYQNDDLYEQYFEPFFSAQSRDNGRRGFASQNYNLWENKLLEWVNNYSLRSDNHDLKVMAGFSYQQFVNRGFHAENADFPSEGYTYNNLGQGTWNSKLPGDVVGSWKEKNQLASYYGRVIYTYNDTYIFTGSVRADGSSRFGENNKWGVFPALSGAWRVSNMTFMQNASFVNDLKVRFGWGIAGRQDFANYTALSTYGGAGKYWVDGTWLRVFGPDKNPNADLKWETSHNYNLGFDFSLFNNKLTGSIDIFQRDSKNLIYAYPATIPSLIQESITVNVGSMRGRGIEWNLNWSAVSNDNFSYSTEFLGSYGQTKLLSLSNGTYQRKYIDMYGLPSPGNPGNAIRNEEGKAVGNFFAYRYAGVDDAGNIMLWLRERDAAGNIIVNPDGSLTEKRVAMTGSAKKEEDKEYIGNGIPKVQLSLNNIFTYKNWSLTLFFRSYLFYDILNLKQMYYGLQALPTGVNVLQDAYTRNGHIKGEKEYCDYFLENGNFLKLDVISLGYTFKLPENKYIKNLHLYATCKNAFTITGYTGLDPAQVTITGLEPGIEGKGSYPTARIFTLGVRASF